MGLTCTNLASRANCFGGKFENLPDEDLLKKGRGDLGIPKAEMDLEASYEMEYRVG